MSASDWLALFSICLMGAFSPGPSQAMVLSCVAHYGKAAGMRAALGHGLGVLLYAFASATGLSVLILTHEQVFTYAQIAGSGLLLYIAFGLFRAAMRPARPDAAHGPENVTDAILLKSFRDGFLIAVFNPKIAVFFLSLFSQFLGPEQTIVTHILMGLLAGGIDTFAYVSIVMLASLPAVTIFLARYERSQNLLFAIILGLLAVSIAIPSLSRII